MIAEQKVEWVFERVSPMGGARATAWRDTLEGSDLFNEQRIAREAIQNSVDATLRGKRTEVLVWNKTLSGKEVATLREILALDSHNSPTGRLSRLGLQDVNALTKIKAADQLQVTIIEDRNTCGLGFDKMRGKDRFKELCLFLGQESTDVDAARGGSYGFGKTVYQASSDCHTFIVYSVFEPVAQTDQAHARLFGCSSFIGHSTEDGIEYTGRAWFGLRKEALGSEICDPIVNEAAHEIADAIGFVKRSKMDIGTSIMIIGSDLNLGTLREAVEDYWWPRIISDQLWVDLWKDEDPLQPPIPLKRPQLRPYIRCYRLVEDTELPIEEKEHRHRLNARQGVQRGILALKGVAPDDDRSQGDPDEDTRLENTVALIRSGPRMVVQYLDTGGRQRSGFVGAFVSHPDAERALHLSEPPSHDAWNINTGRLSNADTTSKDLVKSVLNNIKQRARKFQADLTPNAPPEQFTGTRKLEQLLASVMSSRGLGSRPEPPANPDPFEMHIYCERENSYSDSIIVAKVEVKLRQDGHLGNP